MASVSQAINSSSRFSPVMPARPTNMLSNTSSNTSTTKTNYPSSAKQVGASLDSKGNIVYSSGSSGYVQSLPASEIVAGSGAKKGDTVYAVTSQSGNVSVTQETRDGQVYEIERTPTITNMTLQKAPLSGKDQVTLLLGKAGASMLQTGRLDAGAQYGVNSLMSYNAREEKRFRESNPNIKPLTMNIGGQFLEAIRPSNGNPWKEFENSFAGSLATPVPAFNTKLSNVKTKGDQYVKEDNFQVNQIGIANKKPITSTTYGKTIKQVGNKMDLKSGTVGRVDNKIALKSAEYSRLKFLNSGRASSKTINGVYTSPNTGQTFNFVSRARSTPSTKFGVYNVGGRTYTPEGIIKFKSKITDYSQIAPDAKVFDFRKYYYQQQQLERMQYNPSGLTSVTTTSLGGIKQAVSVRPIIYTGVDTQSGTRTITGISPLSSTSERIVSITAVKDVVIPSSGQFVIPATTQTTRLIQIPTPTTIQTPRITTITPTIMPPFIPIPKVSPFPRFDGGGGKSKRFAGKRKYRYTPSYEAFAFNIRGKKPTGIETGARLRPITKGFKFYDKKNINFPKRFKI